MLMHFRHLAGIFILIFLALSARLNAADAIGSPATKALQTDPFPILPWDQTRLLAGAEDRVRGLASLAECNFTFAGFPRVTDLPACERLGLKAIVMPSKSLAPAQDKHLSDEEIDQAVRQLAEETRNSPACVGFFVCDEPGASQFKYLGQVVAAIRRHAPGKLAYINLFPSYAIPGEAPGSQLEAKDFTTYLERYVAEVKPQFISYDNYMVEYSQDLRDHGQAASYFRDLIEVRRVALKHNLPFWNIVTCVQIRPNTTTPSPANLLLQAWTTLAAGGRGVSWYKYEQQGYLYCPIDISHQRTATWSYLQMVNHQSKVIGPIVGGMRSDGVYFTAPAPSENGRALPGKFDTKLGADAPLMIGEFASHDKTVDHLVVVNLSLERTAKIHIQDLGSAASVEEYSPQDGHLAKCGTDLYLPAGQGVLLKVTRVAQ
jgi:hypothetical protein